MKQEEAARLKKEEREARKAEKAEKKACVNSTDLIHRKLNVLIGRKSWSCKRRKMKRPNKKPSRPNRPTCLDPFSNLSRRLPLWRDRVF
jgi:hypothetical protein